MSKQMMQLLKIMGLILLSVVLVTEGSKMLRSACGKQGCRHRRRLKQDAGKAMCVMGDLLEDVECLLKKH